MVRINGKQMDIEGKNLAEFLADEEYDPAHIAVEKNGTIVAKSEYGHTILRQGDTIEIVSFKGGG